MTFKVPGLDTLGILVGESKHIDLNVGRPKWRSFVAHKPWQKTVIEAYGIAHICAYVSISRPAHFPNKDGKVAVSNSIQSGNQSVELGIEDISVGNPVINNVVAIIEECIVNREVVIAIEAQERVYIHGEGGVVLS